MCRGATIRVVARAGLAAVPLCLFGPIFAQGTGVGWRHIGNSAIEMALPSVATGPVDRVWYSPDGLSLFAKTNSGRVFRTTDFEQWQLVTDSKATPPVTDDAAAATTPEAAFKVSRAGAAGRLYGAGQDVYRSDDAGVSWVNLTSYQGLCLLGPGLRAVAASPADPDDVVVASETGVWRSLDGGLSWSGLNQFLPNLPAGRVIALPSGTRGVRLSLSGTSVTGAAQEIEWAPGEKSAWKPRNAADVDREANLKGALSQVLKHSVTAIASAKDYIYAGDNEGRLQVSPDAGANWGAAFKLGEQGKPGDQGKVEAIWVDASDPRVAVAVLGARASVAAGAAKPAYVLRTMNGGSFWDDITANLPEGAAAHGVAADRASGAIYVATDAGLFYTTTDLGSAGRPTVWNSLSEQLPAVAATDVKLDAGGNQLFAVLDGYGVYTAIAPHRLHDARIVNAADYSARATAPGALLSVLGARVESARSEDVTAPVLDANDTASQIQVPFEVKGTTLSLALESTSGPMSFGVQLKSASPAIFVDPDGTPLILDAQSGVLLDANKPAHASSKVQVLATGLGQVSPDWPTGLAAPLQDPPAVVATVHAYLDGSPVEVTRATLAPGYVGFYLIEIQMPRIADTGPAELYIEAEGQQSNRVRIYVEQ
ncbi:MAG TPA: hypothetical protein VK724_23695 [Bryobacteraceae bacterium]|nr:hypothetical protein [Bryobacteraceae bacterium]